MGEIQRLRGLGGGSSDDYPIGMNDEPPMRLDEDELESMGDQGITIIGGNKSYMSQDDDDDMPFDLEEHPLYKKLCEWDPRWEEWGFMFEEEQWDEEILPAVQCNFFAILLDADEVDCSVCGWDNLAEARDGIAESIKEGYSVGAFYDMIKRRILPVEIKIDVVIHLKPIEVDVSDRDDTKEGITRL